MIHRVFAAATSQPAPKGFAHSPQSRAVYGVDIMLQWITSKHTGSSLHLFTE